jgi:hypothetical protein
MVYGGDTDNREYYHHSRSYDEKGLPREIFTRRRPARQQVSPWPQKSITKGGKAVSPCELIVFSG